MFVTSGQAELTPDLHAVFDLNQTGLLVGDTVDFHQAFMTNSHEAEWRSLLPADRRATRVMLARRTQNRGCDGYRFRDLQDVALKLYADRFTIFLAILFKH